MNLKDKNKRLFIVEGSGIIEDYLRLAPWRLRLIAYQRKYEALVSSWQLPRDCRTLVMEERGMYPSKSPFWAEIFIEELTEDHLFEALKERSSALLVACSNITDPRNLGAIVRNCGFFSVPFLIIPQDRQARLSDVCVATSQAGFAITSLVCVVNLNRCLEKLKKEGFWILGADMDGESIDSFKADHKKSCLVLGSEDTGMAALTKKICDQKVAIVPPFPTIDSLNVSVASGILLSRLSSRLENGDI